MGFPKTAKSHNKINDHQVPIFAKWSGKSLGEGDQSNLATQTLCQNALPHTVTYLLHATAFFVRAKNAADPFRVYNNGKAP